VNLKLHTSAYLFSRPLAFLFMTEKKISRLNGIRFLKLYEGISVTKILSYENSRLCMSEAQQWTNFTAIHVPTFDGWFHNSSRNFVCYLILIFPSTKWCLLSFAADPRARINQVSILKHNFWKIGAWKNWLTAYQRMKLIF